MSLQPWISLTRNLAAITRTNFEKPKGLVLGEITVAKEAYESSLS